ncbi:uncharacterized protein B0H18DRAFT_238801 [Fomitopsis serialis]|uniref:uncharacterized protein n=1 Tax=Fomitopsis serialis TaxID=139415 RepID=UPI0020088840|nr:uncharacterized protein B0H18DRAFT_238801 [Neoantrodia serialis]KAH9912719.1 hypothetical protein B0H18DRAFT_238801 [Neoantrodia serialis]
MPLLSTLSILSPSPSPTCPHRCPAARLCSRPSTYALWPGLCAAVTASFTPPGRHPPARRRGDWLHSGPPGSSADSPEPSLPPPAPALRRGAALVNITGTFNILRITSRRLPHHPHVQAARPGHPTPPRLRPLNVESYDSPPRSLSTTRLWSLAPGSGYVSLGSTAPARSVLFSPPIQSLGATRENHSGLNSLGSGVKKVFKFHSPTRGGAGCQCYQRTRTANPAGWSIGGGGGAPRSSVQNAASTQ